MKNDPTSPKALVRYGIYGAVLIVVTWVGSAFIVISLTDKPKGAGEFGDLFGAINALFSGLAFLGVILAIVLQRQELIEQRLEIKNSRIAQEQSANALQKSMEDAKLRTQLESLNLVITSYRHLLDQTRITTTLSEKENREKIKRELLEYEAKLKILVHEIIK